MTDQPQGQQPPPVYQPPPYNPYGYQPLPPYNTYAILALVLAVLVFGSMMLGFFSFFGAVAGHTPR